MDERNLYFPADFEVNVKPKPIENSLENQMIAMGKALLRAKKVMSIEERKLLMMGLTKIKWNKEGNPLEVELSKVEVADVMQWNYDSSDRSRYIRQLATNLMRHSMIQIDGADKEEWDDGMLIVRIRSTRGSVFLNFAEQFRPLLENLTRDKDFVTIWANDIYHFKSIHSYLLFEELRLHCDTTQTNFREYTTKQLKEIFEIPRDGEGSYMRFDKNQNKMTFNRPMFEKQVLDKAIAEINSGKMMSIYPIPGTEGAKKGKCYDKLKRNGYVSAYQFKYVVRTRTVKPDYPENDVLPGQMSILDYPGLV